LEIAVDFNHGTHEPHSAKSFADMVFSKSDRQNAATCLRNFFSFREFGVFRDMQS
jgi:hypothetical protein